MAAAHASVRAAHKFSWRDSLEFVRDDLGIRACRIVHGDIHGHGSPWGKRPDDRHLYLVARQRCRHRLVHLFADSHAMSNLPPDIYARVHELAVAIVNASAAGDVRRSTIHCVRHCALTTTSRRASGARIPFSPRQWPTTRRTHQKQRGSTSCPLSKQACSPTNRSTPR